MGPQKWMLSPGYQAWPPRKWMLLPGYQAQAPQEVDAQPWVPGTGPQEVTEQEYKPCAPWKALPGDCTGLWELTCAKNWEPGVKCSSY